MEKKYAFQNIKELYKLTEYFSIWNTHSVRPLRQGTGPETHIGSNSHIPLRLQPISSYIGVFIHSYIIENTCAKLCTICT